MTSSEKNNVFIIHGAGGSPEENWFGWLKTELEKFGCAVFVPQFPIDDKQTLDGWLKTFQNYDDYLNERTVFIGHSLGVAFILRLLEKKKAKAALLIAGMHQLPNNQFDNIIESFVAGEFDWEAITSNCKAFQVIQGTDDPYISRNIAMDLAAKLNIQAEFIENAGHFNAPAGYTEFHLLLEKLKLILSLKINNDQNMKLSDYHQKYQAQSDEEILRRADEKERELNAIFKEISLNTDSAPTKVAILGCGDKRFVTHHKRIFENVLKRNVEVTTFDVTIDHLAGEKNIFQHDCTLPLPNQPYDITYAHVLMKFIEPSKQFDLLKNSFDSLKSGGLAIHIFDKEEIETKNIQLPDGLWAVPLEQYKQRLSVLGIEYKIVLLKYGSALILFHN